MNVLFVSLLVTGLLNAVQESPSTQTGEGRVEILSTEVRGEIEGANGRTWRPSNPDTTGAVVIRIRVARGAEYRTTDLLLAYGPGPKQRAVCAGHTAIMPNTWVISEEGTNWSFFPGGSGTLDGLGVLFLVPKGTAKATLLFNGKPVGLPVELKRQ